uniref:Titin n=1 Tax=Monopterus albus TaxID=43700 RepID=A0A3Q3JL08_MONAL
LQLALAPAVCLSYTVKDLIPGELYKVRVSAVNGSGEGEASVMPHTVQAFDRLTSPEIDIDANFKQTHIVKNGGTVSLRASFHGKPVPLATWSKVDGELPVMADISTTDSLSTLTIEDCTRCEAGKYTLSLENNSGHKSITFNVKVLDTPGPPGEITFKDVTCGALTMMWDAPTNDGGSRIHHYIVDKREASHLAWQEVSTKCSRQMIRITGLDIGVPYVFRVIAVNQYGQGEPNEMTEPIIATEAPAPPKRLDVVDTTNSTLITCKLKETDRINVSLDRLNHLIQLLVFLVSDTPGPPGDKVVISRVTEEKCTVSWKIPLEDGGDRVTHYIVERRETSRLNWAVVETECKTLSCVSTRLIKNNEYIFRVRGVNKFGPGVALESEPIIARNVYSKLQHFSE